MCARERACESESERDRQRNDKDALVRMLPQGWGIRDRDRDRAGHEIQSTGDRGCWQGVGCGHAAIL